MTPADRTPGDRIGLAVTAILATALALSLGDALVRRVSTSFTIWQVFVIRSAIVLPVLALALAVGGRSAGASLSIARVGWIAARSALLAGMWVAYYAALPHLPLSVAAAAYYTAPLFITLLSAMLLAGPVGVLGWTAVFAGFCGVLLILRPDADVFSPYSLLPVLAALLYALAMILTRAKCRNESPLVLSLALNLAFIGLGGAATLLIELWGHASPVMDDAFLWGGWAPMDAEDWSAMVVLATATAIGSIGAAIAYQWGPPSVVATFDFSYVAFAVLWGVLLFAEVPDPVTLAGIALIAAAGILAVRR